MEIEQTGDDSDNSNKLDTQDIQADNLVCFLYWYICISRFSIHYILFANCVCYFIKKEINEEHEDKE